MREEFWPDMLTASGCRRRRERFWESLPDKPDIAILCSPRHITYFTGFYPSPFVFRTQNASAVLILGADGSSLLIADNLLFPFAEASHVDSVEALAWYRSTQSAPPRDELLIRAALDALRTRSMASVGIDSRAPASLVAGLRASRPSLETVDIGDVMHRLMRAKQPDEMEVMRRSISAAEAGFSAAARLIVPGMTELQAYDVVSRACMEAAGEQVVVYGDFASGPNAIAGGGGPTKRVIQEDDLFILDCSVIVNGYRGDFANTFVVAGGKASAELHEMEGACLGAMAAGERTLKAGASCVDVDSAVRDSFKIRGLDRYFTHHSGHGLGLGHPDPPYIVPLSADSLETGDVVTLEPGLYIPNLAGMRFERNYLITDNGFEQLTNHYVGLEPSA